MRNEKLHAIVARSTFGSQNAKNTCAGTLLGIQNSKKCTPLWREALLEVKMTKHLCRSTFGSSDVEKVHAVVARSTFPQVKMYKTHHVRSTVGSSDVEKMHAVLV